MKRGRSTLCSPAFSYQHLPQNATTAIILSAIDGITHQLFPNGKWQDCTGTPTDCLGHAIMHKIHIETYKKYYNFKDFTNIIITFAFKFI